MSSLLEILGRGLLSELSAAFRELLRDDGRRATKELEADAARDPENIDFTRSLAVRMLADRQYARAQRGFSAVLARDPLDRVSRIGLACTFDDLGQTSAALEALQGVARGNGDGATLFALGFCKEKLGKSDEAIRLYQAALEIAPNVRNAHERLAAIHLRQERVAEAIAHYEHLCWCEPGEARTALTLAHLYLRGRRYEDAVRRFEFAVTLDPDNWEAKDDLVSAHVAAGRYADAAQALRECITQRPECAELYQRLGDVHTKAGEDAEALAAYRAAVELRPDYLEATIKIGTAHLRCGRYEDAALSFSGAIEINDRIVDAYVGAAVAYQALGRTDDAKLSLEQAAGVEPNSTLLFSEMARLQLKVAAAEQRRRYLAPEAIARSPGGPPDERIATLIDRQVARLRGAVAEHPNHADLHYRLGVLLRHTGDVGGAIESFTRALAINPRYLKAVVKLSLALRATGRIDAAIDAARRALDIDAEALELHYQLGLMYYDRNQFALALDRFDRAVREAPDNLDYVGNLGLALQNMGLTDRAAETWRLLAELSEPGRESERMPNARQRLRS